MNQRNETPRAATQWIGGSYLTACNGKFPPGRTSTRVLAALQEQPGLTTLELSHQLHLSSHALKHALERLKAAGKIYAEKKMQYRSVGGGLINCWHLSSKDLS